MSNGGNEVWHGIVRMRAVNGNCPLRFFKLANIGQDIRKLAGSDWVVRKQESVVVNTLQFQGTLYPSVTAAPVVWVRKPTVLLHEANNLLPSAFQSLAKSPLLYS
jgi:hypothetical protein